MKVVDEFPPGVDRDDHTAGAWDCPCGPWVKTDMDADDDGVRTVRHVEIEIEHPPQTFDREELISLCVAGIVQQDKWGNRDSPSSQQKLGMAWALLSAGCHYEVLREGKSGLHTDDETVWIEVTFKGFNDFEYGEDASYTETFYLPTRKRLVLSDGRDWY